MNAQVNTKSHAAGTILVRTNQVTIRPERMVVRKEEAGVHAAQRPYNWFERLALTVIGTLRAQRLI